MEILVINALNGVFPLVLQKRYPSARITCAEIFPFYKHHLRNLGFEVVDWNDVVDMKFDLVIGNPPFSKVGEDKMSGKRGQELYIKFYRWAVDNATTVAMVMPTTDKKVQQTHNDLLRATANKIEYIDPACFPGITMPMWYVISDKNQACNANIDWQLNAPPGNDIPWVKGAVNMTTHKHANQGSLGTTEPKSKSDILIYHKVNVTHGLVKVYCSDSVVSKSALFPNTGYAVLMPQTFNEDGWSQTAVVKCNGRQAAFNGMNIVFVKTKNQADRLIQTMKSQQFIDGANQVKQGFNNMNLSCLRIIKLDKSFDEIINHPEV